MTDNNLNHYSSPRGILSVEDGVTFKRKGGWFISKGSVVILAICAVFVILVTAVFTRHYTKKQYDHTEEDSKSFEAIVSPMVNLSGEVVPWHYRVMFQPYLNTAPLGKEKFQLVGYIRIFVKVKEATSQIQLHSSGLNISENKTKLEKYVENRELEGNESTTLDPEVSNSTLHSYVNVRSHKYDNQSEILTIKFEEKLELQKIYILDLHFSAQISDTPLGIYRSSFVDGKTGETKWIVTSQFEPTFARRAFPCFDEPSLKATFEISILRRHNMSSLSNTERRNEQPVGDGWVWDHYETSPPMPPFLVTIAVSDLSVTKVAGNSPYMSIWARSDFIQDTLFASDVAPKIVSFLSQFLGVLYPLPKLDLMAVPHTLHDSMENYGLINFRESAVLYSETSNSFEDKVRTLQTIGHGIAHHWFGNLVTMKWWNTYWLNEGLATYFGYMAAGNVEPDSVSMELLVTTHVQNGLLEDTYGSSQPLSGSAERNVALEYFDPMEYSKGAALIRMVAKAVGETNFKAGLKAYLNKWANKNADPSDLWECLDSAMVDNGTSAFPQDFNLTEVMPSWTSLSGYPVVDVTIDTEAGEVMIKQKQFSLIPSNAQKLWHIPIVYLTNESDSSDLTVKQWLRQEESIKIEVPSVVDKSWIIVNPERIGFYRVNYDAENWELLTNELKDKGDDKFTLLTRAQLIDDSFQLARAGMLNYSIPLNLSLYLRNVEKSYGPWSAAVSNIKFLYLLLWDSPHYPQLREYVLWLITPLYKGLGTVKWADEDPIQSLLRKLIVEQACLFEMPECISWTKSVFDSWAKANDTGTDFSIAPEMKYVIACTAVRTGGKKEVDFIWDLLAKPGMKARDQEILISSLACSSSPWVLNMLLSETLSNDSSIPKQIVPIIWKAFADQPAAANVVFDFFRNNWDAIYEKYDKQSSTIGKIISSSTSGLTTESQLQALNSLRADKFSRVANGQNHMNKAIDKLKANVEWRSKKLPEVLKWLNSFINTQYFGM